MKLTNSLWLRRLLFLLAVAGFGYAPASAQSTIINTPSTDVVAPRQIYVEADFLTHPTRFRDGGYRLYAGRVVYGVRQGLEVGANVVYTDAFEPNQPVEFQPNAKLQVYRNEAKGITVSTGAIAYIPVKNRAGTDTFVFTYSNVSKKFQGKYGPRVTVGGYANIGAVRENGSRGGATMAYEQPLHRKFSLVGDWLSGKNRFGYVAPGFIYTPTAKSLIGASYIMGNEGRGNNGLYVFFGYTFN